MINPIISVQDAHTYRQLFERSGYEQLNSIVSTEYPNLLQKSNLRAINPSQEVIISHLKIEQDRGGVISFLKLVALPVSNVSVYHVYSRKQNGAETWRISDGELFITNSRIILFFKSQASNTHIDKSIELAFEQIEQVWYEQNIFVIRFKSRDVEICFNMKFPAASIAQGLGQLADETPSERYNSARTRQDIDRLASKRQDAQTVLYQFFLAVIQHIQMRLTRKNTPQKSAEALELLEKLGALKTAGLITEDEFNKKKDDILSRF